MSATPDKIDLVRDVLDKLLIDRDEIPLGRVDGIIFVIENENSEPRLSEIETGSTTLARRLGATFAKIVQHLVHAIGLRWKKPIRVDWSDIHSVGKELKLGGRWEESPLTATERWLRDHIIRRIPGNGFKPEAEK